jgi:hypothetical protein
MGDGWIESLSREMREGIWNQAGTRPRTHWTGAVLIAIGLSVLLLVGEWFAAFEGDPLPRFSYHLLTSGWARSSLDEGAFDRT